MSMLVSDTDKLFPKNVFLHVNYAQFVGGVSGGLAATLILHPFDLLKIRFAANDGLLHTRPNYKGLRNAVSTIFRDEGFRGFYRGVTPNCWGAGASWGLFFFFNNAIKSYIIGTDENAVQTLGPGRTMLAAATAGSVTLLITNPIWVVKTRMCLQYGSTFDKSSLPPDKQYRGMFDALTKLYRYEGIKGMYKGLVPGIFGTSHGALQYMSYVEMKRMCVQFFEVPSEKELGPQHHLLCSALSKLFAASVTYPYQVIRTRLQDQHKEYSGVIEIIQRIWKYEGVKGYYKGIVPNLLRVTPAAAITYVVYESVVKNLQKT